MTVTVTILHAPSDEAIAEALAAAVRDLGYQVWHTGDVLVGDVPVKELSDHLAMGGPVVICGTAKAVGSKWLRKIIAHVQGPNSPGIPRVFPARMEMDADLESIGFGVRVAECATDLGRGVAELGAALRTHFPNGDDEDAHGEDGDASETPDDTFDNWLTPISLFSADALRVFRDALRPEIRSAKLPDDLDPIAFLQAANLFARGRLFAAGVLLVGSSPEQLVPSAYVQCVRYRGVDKSAAQDSREFYGPLISQITGALTFVESQVERTEVIEPGVAAATFQYQFPMTCLREIIANALCHRDYTDHQRHVHVRLFTDRIEVVSPGLWVSRGLDSSVEHDLVDLVSEPASRNERLATALRWVKLVETQGSGIPNALVDCSEQGADPPRVISQDGMIKVTVFPRRGWSTAAVSRRTVKPAPAPIYSVYLASTADDLISHRLVADDTLLRLSQQTPTLEREGPMPGDSAADRERKARDSDIVVCIVGHRYGFVPEPDGRSDTQREIEAARDAGRTVLVWIVADDYPWTQKKEQDLLLDADVRSSPARVSEVVKSVAALHRFKAWLRDNFVCETFTTPDDLGRKLAVALTHAVTDQERVPQGSVPTVAIVNGRRIVVSGAGDWAVRNLPDRVKGGTGEIRIVHALQPAPHFRGRDELLAELLSWVGDVGSRDRVVSLIAPGGTGKTALLERVVRDMKPGAANVIVWSFYEQPDSDAFLRECNQLFLGESEGLAGGRLERLERGLRDGRPHVLVLDGLERVQEDAGGGRVRGALSDQTLKLLLQAISAGLGRSRAIVTSRFPLSDLRDWDRHGYREIRLDDLTPEAAVDVLRGWGVTGDDASLWRAVEQVGRHALSVAVIGSYLRSFGGGRIEEVNRFALESVTGDDPKAARLARILAFYAEKLPAEERELLARMSVFPHGVSLELLGVLVDAGGEVAGVLVNAKPRLVPLLVSLKSRGLVFEYRSDTTAWWTAHPFLRERFRALLAVPTERVFDAVALAFAKDLERNPATKPSDAQTLDRYEQLIEATRLAGRVREAFELYRSGLGGYAHLGRTLGDYARGHRILAAFGNPLEDLGASLAVSNRIVLANELAAYALRMGRLDDAWGVWQVSDKRLGLVGARVSPFFRSRLRAQISYARGRLADASHWADIAVERTEGDFAVAEQVDALPQPLERRNALALRAAVAHATGEIELARKRFAAASDPAQLVVPVADAWRARHLLDLGALDAARSVTEESLAIARRTGANDEIANLHALMARVQLVAGENPTAYLSEVRALTARTGELEAIVEAHLLTAHHLLVTGDVQSGIAEAETGLLKAVAVGYGLLRIELLIALARLRLKASDAAGARTAAREALDLAAHPDCRFAWGEADALQVIGEAMLARHDGAAAMDAFSHALVVRRRIEHPGVSETERWLARAADPSS